MPSKLSTFLGHNSADLVNILCSECSPKIENLLHNFCRIANRPDLLPNFGCHSHRQLAISLLDLLRVEAEEMEELESGECHLFMAFLCALLRSGYLRLFCQFFRLHLVDSMRFQQFARTNDSWPFFPNGKAQLPSAAEIAEEVTGNGEDEADHLSPRIDYESRREYVERHSEVIRMKLDQVETIGKMFAEWGICPESGEAEGEERNCPSEGEDEENGINNSSCEQLIAILLTANGEALKKPTISRAFECFCLALLATRQFRMFSIFHELADLDWTERCWRHFLPPETNGDDTESERDEDGEKPELKGILENLHVEMVDSGGPIGGNTAFDMMAHYREHHKEIYANFTSPKGLALIINNFYFGDRRGDREGSQVDMANVRNLFQQLNYQVHQEHDLTGEEIHRAMRQYAARPEHRELDSAVVVLMSHGENGTLLGTDDRPVEVLHLVRELCEIPGLRGKPKIFIVQACRGDKKDDGIPRPLRPHESIDGPGSSMFSSLKASFSALSHSSSSSSSSPSFTNASKSNGKKGTGPFNVSNIFRSNPPPPSPVPSSSPSSSFRQHHHHRQGSSSSSSSPKNVPSQQQQHLHHQHHHLNVQHLVTEPTCADVLIAYATTANYVSWRNSSRGSWFIQTLCEVFSRRAKQEDILTMLAKVNGEVAKREANPGEPERRRYKQVPEQTTRLRRKFYFFPGKTTAL